MVSDYKPKIIKTSSTKKTISHINRVLRICIWTSLGISGTIMFFCAIAYILNSDIFLVKNIEIQGNTNVKKEDITRVIDIEEGENILSWDMDAARQRLLKHPWIKDASISRNYIPTGVIVCLQEHKPTATLVLKDKPYLISEEGVVFATCTQDPYGLIIHAPEYDSSNIAQDLTRVIKEALNAVKIAGIKGLKVKDLIIGSGGRMEIRLDSGISLVVLGEITSLKVDLALKTINQFKPSSGTIMDLTCEDKIILRNRGSHGS